MNYVTTTSRHPNNSNNEQPKMSAPFWQLLWRMAVMLGRTQDVSTDQKASLYRQIKWVTDWQLLEDDQRQALAQVVNAISKLDVTQAWGKGKHPAAMGSDSEY